MTLEVDITGDELLNILTTMEVLVLDRYVRARRRHKLSHEQAKKFVACARRHTDCYQRSIDNGLSFEQFYELAQEGYDMRIIFREMEKGATLDAAKEMPPAWLSWPRYAGLTHQEIMAMQG